MNSNMMTIQEFAYAKINLSIDIVSKMDNGYHNMRMIMQSISLHDDIDIMAEKGEGIEVSTDLRYLPNDERNIAYRAATTFINHTGRTGYKLKINIKKRIPVCAGLGGGSTDGAAVLRGLNRMFKTGLDSPALEKLSELIGSDVPFCVSGGTALAEGRGEMLTDLEPLAPCSIVVCKPSFAISTPELFSKIVCDKIHLRPDTTGLIEALKQQSITGVSRRMYNVFEDVLPKGTSAIGEIKAQLCDCGAVGAMMTGTGSAVFGVFRDDASARTAYAALSQNYQECFFAKPMQKITNEEFC